MFLYPKTNAIRNHSLEIRPKVYATGFVVKTFWNEWEIHGMLKLKVKKTHTLQFCRFGFKVSNVKRKQLKTAKMRFAHRARERQRSVGRKKVDKIYGSNQIGIDTQYNWCLADFQFRSHSKSCRLFFLTNENWLINCQNIRQHPFWLWFRFWFPRTYIVVHNILSNTSNLSMKIIAFIPYIELKSCT